MNMHRGLSTIISYYQDACGFLVVDLIGTPIYNGLVTSCQTVCIDGGDTIETE